MDVIGIILIMFGAIPLIEEHYFLNGKVENKPKTIILATIMLIGMVLVALCLGGVCECAS